MALAPSNLSPQTELLKDDLDLKSLDLQVQGRVSLAIRALVTGASATRTIDGASTITLNVRDRERLILRSGYLAQKVDIQIDGLWFRLKAAGKQGDDLTLTFEDREVAILRDYPKPNAPHRFLVRSVTTTSRLQFAELLVAEVTELPIRFVTPNTYPQLLQDAGKAIDKKSTTHARGYGFAPGAAITVKGAKASPDQRSNIDHVLQAGVAAKVRRKLLVVSVMVVTVESQARNLRLGQGDRDSIGLFQQRPSQGWGSVDQLSSVDYQALKFFQAAISDDKKHPSLGYGALAQDVQVSAFPDAYDLWRDEAEATVTAWGVQPGASDATPYRGSLPTDGSFQFQRGTMTVAGGKKTFTREDNWSCLQRLASEVQWRCFCVSGVVYFMPDLDLLASQPQMTLSEASDGIDSIDGSFDEGRISRRKGHKVQLLNQAVTIPCRIGRWQAPPGTAVELVDMGPFDGRWIVAAISRGLFAPDGTITLKRPQTALPEAKAPEYLQPGGVQVYTPPTGGAVAGGIYVAPGTLVQPIPKEFSRGHGPVHDTLGLTTLAEGGPFPAIDFFAHPGSPVVAPEGGKISRFSGHDPAQGPIGAPGGPLGWSIYLQGDSGTTYYITHLDTRTVKVGDTVTIAQQIATVADYDKWGRQSHTHVGVHGGSVTIEMLGAAPLAEKAVPVPADTHHH